MRIDKLKPCPFCGGNQICVNVGIYIGKAHESVTIKCDDCGASIWGITEEKAIAAWNRRARETCHIVKASRKYMLSDGTELFENGCSVCNGYIGEGDNYCPNCGAKVVTS